MIQPQSTPKKGGKLNPVKDRLIKPPEQVQNKTENELNMTQIKIIKTVSKGEYSIVHKVSLKTKATKFYALKEIDKKLIKKMKLVSQLQQEVDNLNKISHSHIIKIFNHFEEQSHVYLLMEYATGGTLQQKISKSKPTQKQIKNYIVQILDALDYLHNTIQIVHRNLKPENILISDKDEIKLADFGFSNEVLSGGSKRMTVLGEDEYRPPEMIKGFPHNQKVDVWGVGILLYQLLTGKTPFIPENEEQTIEKNIVSSEVKFPVNIPLFIQDFIKQCLVKSQKQRPTIQELRKHNWLVTDDTVKLYNIDLTPNSDFEKFKEQQKQKFLQQKQAGGGMSSSKSTASMANSKKTLNNGTSGTTSHKNLASTKKINNIDQKTNKTNSVQVLESPRKNKKSATTLINSNSKNNTSTNNNNKHQFLKKGGSKHSIEGVEKKKKQIENEKEIEQEIEEVKQEQGNKIPNFEELKNDDQIDDNIHTNGDTQNQNSYEQLEQLQESQQQKQNSITSNGYEEPDQQSQSQEFQKSTSIQSTKSAKSIGSNATPKYSLVKDEDDQQNFEDGEECEKKLLTKIDYEIPKKKSFQIVENCSIHRAKIEMLQNLKRKTISKLDKKKLIYQDLKMQNEMLKEKYFQYRDYSIPDFSIPESLQILKDDQKILQIYNRYKGKMSSQMQKVQDLQDDLTQKSRKIELQNSEFQELMQLFQQSDQQIDFKNILDEQIIAHEEELQNLERENLKIDTNLSQIELDQEVSTLRKEIFQPQKITDDEKICLKENYEKIHLILMKNQEVTEILEMIQNQNQQLSERFSQQVLRGDISSIKSHYSTASTRPGTSMGSTNFRQQNSNQQDYDTQITQMKQNYTERETILKKKQDDDTTYYRESLQKMRLSNKQKIVDQQEAYLKKRSKKFISIAYDMEDKLNYNKNLDDEIKELQKQLKEAEEKFEKYKKKKK